MALSLEDRAELEKQIAEQNLTWDDIRDRIQSLAGRRGDFGGIPMPIDNVELVLEPRYPYQGLNGFKLGEDAEPEKVEHDLTTTDGLAAACSELITAKLEETYEVINEWYSFSQQAQIVIYRIGGSGSKVLVIPSWRDRYEFWMHTLWCTEAWDPAAEVIAREKLQGLITKQAWGSYLLSGQFMETSPRSNITYVFRHGKPTVALGCTNVGGNKYPIATLCLHPVGHYKATFAGCLVPTDDVLSHLLLMRGDEHRFWRQANQHVPMLPNSGL